MRTPDPTIQRYRAHINLAALSAGALGILMVLDPRLKPYGLVIMFGAVMGYAFLTSRARPKFTDYLEHLHLSAGNAGHDEWLAGVEAEFKELWGIEDLEDLE